MRRIDAFETPDNKRFFDENEARAHERRYDFGNQIDMAVGRNPQFAKLDREMLIDFFMRYGSDIGKLAESPITPTDMRNRMKKFEAPRAPTGQTVPARPVLEPVAPQRDGQTVPARPVLEPVAPQRAVPEPPTFDEFSKTLEESMMRELGLDGDID